MLAALIKPIRDLNENGGPSGVPELGRRREVRSTS